MKRWLTVLMAAFIVAGIWAAAANQVRAQAKPEWAMKDCYTLDDVTAFLNKLPPDRATDAKVLAINSQRSFLGTWSTPYYVWYRK